MSKHKRDACATDRVAQASRLCPGAIAGDSTLAIETFTRRNLPHWYMPSATHFVTFRLAGTLPQPVLADLKAHKEQLLKKKMAGQTRASHRALVHKQLFAAYDHYLDRHRDIHWLDDPQVAAMIRRSLYFWNGRKYGLRAYCIMPNHVHVLLRPFDDERASTSETLVLREVGEISDRDSPLSGIMHSLKSYTAHEGNKLLGRTGSFWQHESYDHWVRDEEELERILAYINANPVKAGLAGRACDYLWCSARDRFLQDGDESGWLEIGTSETLVLRNP
jgi:putative transposase